MASTVGRFGILAMVLAVVGSSFLNPAPANAARNHYRLAKQSWDPGNNFRWTYGPSIAWYLQPHNNCGLRRHVYIDGRGRHFVRWVELCY